MSFFLRIFFFTCVIVCCSNCANIIPPTGGARDSLAPILLQTFPKDSTKNFNAKKITLTFNEFVEVKDAAQNFVLNPLPKSSLQVDYKLQNVFITLRDSLEANTTYSINFGKGIQDVNEGNLYEGKSYIFSTGSSIDNYNLTGNVVLAQDGKIDSNLIVVLHNNLSDTSIIKNKPKYLAKLDGKGNFKFTNLPKATFNLFVLPNDFSKKYDDTTKLFAFLNKPISTTDSITNFNMYAYKEAEYIEKKNTAKPSSDDELKLVFNNNLLGGKYDILDTAIVLNFNKYLKKVNIDSVTIIDSNKQKISSSTFYDSATASVWLKCNLNLGTKYFLVVSKNAAVDNKLKGLEKNDTTNFSTLSKEDYGSVKITTKNKTENIVLQIFNGDKLIASLPFENKAIKKEIFKPAEYDLRILFDENNNKKWDAGNYKQLKQPEKVIALKNKLLVKAKWENELEIEW